MIVIKRCLGFAAESRKRNQRSRCEFVALQSWVLMRDRLFSLLYFTAIAVAMIGWVWLLVEAIDRAID